MKRYNLVLVIDKSEQNILMCYRLKDPYSNKYNLLGGKIDEGETDLESAYRELYEESGITNKDILLKELITYKWHHASTEMVVYYGILNKEVTLKTEIHPLHWISIYENFFDINKYAGEGNIGHMLEIYKQTKDM